MRSVAVAIAGLAVLIVAACSSSKDGGSARSALPPSSVEVVMSTASSALASPTVDLAAHDKSACTDLTQNDVLKSAAGFVIVAGVLNPGDVSETVNELLNDGQDVSPELAIALTQISDILTNIDDAVRAQTGEDVDTSQLVPAEHDIAAFCRSHHYPVPEIPAV